MRRLIFLLPLLFGCAARGYGVSGDGGDTDAGTPTTTLTVMQLRNPASADHPALQSEVTVGGCVVTDLKTAGHSHGFFVQDPSAQTWAGVFVFVGTADVTVSIGDVVQVTGLYESYIGLDEIDVTGGSITTTGSASRPSAKDVTLMEITDNGTHTLDYQSMILRVHDVIATSDTVQDQFTIGELTSGATIEVTSYAANDTGPSPFPATSGTMFSTIIGHGYAHGVAELAPMTAGDVVAK